jgi:hypothetical protein
VVTAATFVATIIAAVYIYYQMRIIIRRGCPSASCVPVGDPGTPTPGSDWANFQVRGTPGAGTGVRFEMSQPHYERPSVDITLGPHAGATQQQLDHSPLSTPPLGRTRSLPGPITEDALRTWLVHIDMAVATTTGPQIANTSADEKKGLCGRVPAILLTPTYIPAGLHSDSRRGAQSLDLGRARSQFGEGIPE